jgi:hypothetical protein
MNPFSEGKHISFQQDIPEEQIVEFRKVLPNCKIEY